MSPPEQLARIQVELEEAHRRAHEIVAPLKNEGWGARAAPDQWSVAECLIHLNMTSRAFLPLIKDAIGRGRDRELFRGTPYRMDFVGRLLWLAATLLDLGKLRIVSPFDSRIKYNLYSCLRLIPAHQRLHLRQAEQVVHKVRSTRAG